MVHGLAKMQSSRLLKHVVRCYLRLSDNPRAREALRQVLPEPLRDRTFAACLKVRDGGECGGIKRTRKGEKKKK